MALILPQFCGVGVKPLFYCSTMPAQNEPETYSQNAEQLEYHGLLGMAFLKKHPFQINTERSVIR